MTLPRPRARSTSAWAADVQPDAWSGPANGEHAMHCAKAVFTGSPKRLLLTNVD